MLPSDVRTFPQLRKSNSLPLALTDQVAFELGERSHDIQQQVRHGRVLPGEGQVLLLEPDVDSPFGQSQDDLAEVVQVAGQAIHRVADYSVSFADVLHELLELRPVHVSSRGLVGESLVEIYAFELAQLLLVESAHPQVSDRLAGPPLPFCHVRFSSLHHLVSHYQKCNLCETRVSVTQAVSRRGIPFTATNTVFAHCC